VRPLAAVQLINVRFGMPTTNTAYRYI